MWILESSGDFLQGKRLWLKPGKKYLVGRVKKDGVRFAINHTTVSRKHFILTVDTVTDEDVGKVHARTTVTVEDLKSKAGTSIDGQPLRGSAVELKNAVNSIRLGSSSFELIIRWVPIVLTFSLTKKEIKNGLLKTKQERLKDLDIRVVSDYLTDSTTHLVTGKRNTSKGLQALIQARHIITEAYIDALIYAASPSDVQHEESLSALEMDFDDAWPDAAGYLPPAGKEPTNKPASAYQPDEARDKVFDNHTFFFFTQAQHDTLLSPITTGHGKALLLETTVNATTVDEGLEYIRNSIGLSRKAIIVRLTEEGEESNAWLSKYIEDICVKLSLHSTSQSDFLDAILANNAAQLRTPRATEPSATEATPTNLEVSEHKPWANNQSINSMRATKLGTSEQDSTQSSLSPAPESLRSASALPDSQAAPAPSSTPQPTSTQDDNPRPRKRSRFVAPKKIEKFDDDFDPDAIVPYEEEDSVGPAQVETRDDRAAQPYSESVQVHVKEEPPPQGRSSQSMTPGAEGSDDELDDLLPAAAAMRKEKKRLEAEARRTGKPLKSALVPAKAAPKPRKEVKVLDVREAARARKEAFEAIEEREQRELEDLMREDEGKTGPAGYVEIKEFNIPIRKRLDGQSLDASHGPGWKPEWEGRKNFKGFRRARDKRNGDSITPNRREKIIVPVVAVQKRTYGLGEVYWEKTEEDKATEARDRERRKKTSQKSTQSQRQSQRSTTVHEESSDENDFDDDEAQAVSPETARLQKEAEGILDHPVDLHESRQTRAAETQSTSTSKKTKTSKRPASSTPTRGTRGTKKQKTIPVVHVSDSDDHDDDSDDMKFEFGRARKARAAKQ